MTDVALNSFGKPLSMTDLAIRRRASRAGIPVGLYREMGAGHVRKDGHGAPQKVSRRPPQDIRLATSRDGLPRDMGGDHTSQRDVTKKHNQGLRLVSQVSAPSLAPSDLSRSQSLPPLVPPVTMSRRVTFGRVIVTLLAIMFSVTSIGTNGTYAISQGTTALDVVWLGLYSASYEIGLVAMPLIMSDAWGRRRFVFFILWMGALLICLVAAWFAAAGFAASNFGDTAASRQALINQRNALEADLVTARAQKTAIVIIPTSQAAIDAAREAIPKGCSRLNETLDCKTKRQKLSDLLDHQANAARVDKLEGQIIRLEAALAKTQTAKAADPQIEAVILMVARVSRGGLMFDPRDAEFLRLLTFVFLPLLAGLFLEWAWGDVLSERRSA